MYLFHKAGGLAAGLVFIVLLFSPAGCSLKQTATLSLPAVNPEGTLLEDVPFYPQETFQCGPASLAMVLAWTGLEVTPQDLTDDVYSPGLHGSLQSALISTARQYGQVAYPINGIRELLAEVNAGHPVIVLQNLGFSWYPKYHYGVIIGYGKEGRTIVLHSGKKAAGQLSVRVFQNTWARADYWGLLVMPPEIIPAKATEEKYVLAVAGLERAGQFEAAVRAYKTALSRWPKSFPAWMGLGNSFYARRDLSSAAYAFKQAALLNPSQGLPLNNLAQVFWEQGKKEEALQAIRHAIELGGPYRNLFEETLRGFEKGEKQDTIFPKPR
jgi:tetratricopeptide (TPR) repeat protein